MLELFNHSFRFIDIATLIGAHFVCDFLLQSNWMATNKSSSIRALTSHIATYTLGMLFILSFLYRSLTIEDLILFSLITFTCHWLTDYITSRVGAILLRTAKRTEKYNWFFLNIGFDQILHYMQLFITFYYISK